MTRKKHSGSSPEVDEDNTGAGTFVPVSIPMLATDGENEEKQRTPTVFKSFDLAAATAETTLWTPAAGKKFRLMGMIITAGAATTLLFKDGTAGTNIFRVGAGATPVPIDIGNGILSALANNNLTVTRSVSATLMGTVWGTEE